MYRVGNWELSSKNVMASSIIAIGIPKHIEASELKISNRFEHGLQPNWIVYQPSFRSENIRIIAIYTVKLTILGSAT